MSLPDALELVLLLVDDPRRFRRAALRWHARYCAEVADVGFEEAQAVLGVPGRPGGSEIEACGCRVGRARPSARARAGERGAGSPGRLRLAAAFDTFDTMWEARLSSLPRGRDHAQYPRSPCFFQFSSLAFAPAAATAPPLIEDFHSESLSFEIDGGTLPYLHEDPRHRREGDGFLRSGGNPRPARKITFRSSESSRIPTARPSATRAMAPSSSTSRAP